MQHIIQTFIMTLTISAFTFAGGKIFITEITDPQNSSDAGRYLELYNSDTEDSDFLTRDGGYALQRWTNGNADPTSSSFKYLVGTIPAHGFFIVCNDADKFRATWPDLTCDQDIGTGGAADSNGDDNIALVYAVDEDGDGQPDEIEIVDMFGVPGEDGSGTGHEFEDGRAERADGVSEANSTWDVDEWNIDNDSGGGDGNQYAPEDFDPGEWIGDHGGGSDTCEDDSACNTGSEGDCEFPDAGYDCDGNCVEEDCAGVCGGTAVEDACGVCEGDSSSCSVSVTFSVDMNIEGVTGDIKVRTSTINGEYNPSDWHVMTDDGNGTYSHALSLLTGIEYGYNFNNSDGSGYESGDGLGDCAGGNYGNDRFVTPGDSDMELDTVCWESCEACPEDIPGCTDEGALNYDENATSDDGTCIYDWPETDNLFFSEYAEGSSNNKYLEIYNGSDGDVNLAGYSLSSCSNGCNDGTSWDYPDNVQFNANTNMGAGDVYVVCHGSADDFIQAECDQTFTYLSNGDDVFALTQIGSGDILDIIGTIGDDPGSGWEVAGISNATKDHTLVRDASVDNGNGGNWEESAGDADGSEWVVLDQNTWDYVGSHPHSFDCTLGDANGDGIVNVLDVVVIVNYILNSSDDFDLSCVDVNGDGILNVLDLVAMVSDILGGRSHHADATSAKLIKSSNGLNIHANGYVGGIQMTLQHGSNFSIQLDENAWLSDYSTIDNQTKLVILEPTGNDLFTSHGHFEITEMIIANSQGEINATIATEFSISDAYPNPFNPSTTVELMIPESGQVSVMVYNLTGQLVAELANSYLNADNYQFTWDANIVPSGMYILRTEYAGNSSTQKLMLLK